MLTLEQKQQIKILRNKGKTYQQIADIIGCNKTTAIYHGSINGTELSKQRCYKYLNKKYNKKYNPNKHQQYIYSKHPYILKLTTFNSKYKIKNKSKSKFYFIKIFKYIPYSKYFA